MTAPIGDQQPGGRLTPDLVRNAVFPVARHGGYDAPAVNQFLAAAADQLAAAETEIQTLRAQAERNQQGAKMDVSAETVNLLSRAQVIADKHVSDAEQYAHDLIDTARKQYTEILQKAQDSVTEAPASASPAAADGSRPEYGPPVPAIEYVRTYTRVAQVQLRAVIDALAEQVDQLGELPRFDAPRREAPPAGKTTDEGA
ncbi:MAG TPA: DivIVA domain-containing protein [Micrococcaceae bacterium]|jgi:cell division initiation protein